MALTTPDSSSSSASSDCEQYFIRAKKRRRCSKRKSSSPKPPPKLQPVRSTKMSDSSDSSSSGSESSDSGSESETSSSENEKEQLKGPTIPKATSLTPPPPGPPETTPQSWALAKWANTALGLPGSEALATGSQPATDPNDDIISMIIQDKIPEPSPDPRLDNIATAKKIKVPSDTGLRLTISRGGKGPENAVTTAKASPQATSGWSVRDKTPPGSTAERSPGSAKGPGSSSSRSSVGQSPSRRGRKSSSSKQPQVKVEKEVSKPSPKPSPKKQPPPTTKGSPADHKSRGSAQRQSTIKTKGSPRIVAQKTPPRSTPVDRKSGGGTPKTRRKQQQVQSRELLSSDSSSDEDVDVISITPDKNKESSRAQSPATLAKCTKDLQKGSTTPQGGKGARTKIDFVNTTPVKITVAIPPPVPSLKVTSSSSGDSDSDQEKEKEVLLKRPVQLVVQQPQLPKLSKTMPLEDVFGTLLQDPLLSPIPSSRSSHIIAPAQDVASRKSSLARVPTSTLVHPVTEAPRKKQPLSPRPIEAHSPGLASSASGSESDSGSNSDSSGSGSSSHSTSRASSRASSRCGSRPSSRDSSQASSQASSRAPSPAAKTISSSSSPSSLLSASVSSHTVAITTFVSSSKLSAPPVAAASEPTGLTYGADGKPILIVRLDLALINQLAPVSLPSAPLSLTATSSASSSSSSNLLPPPPPRDVETMNRKPVAVVEPQQSHVDKTLLDMKLEPGVVSAASHHVGSGLGVPRDVHLPHQGPLLQHLHKDHAHMDTAAMAAAMPSHAAPALVGTTMHAANNKDAMSAYLKERDTVMSEIIKDECKPPLQAKIPKRKNADAHTAEHKRARTDHRSASGHGTPSGRTPSGRTPSGRTPTQNTPKRGEDGGEREVTNHEDDHEWDRKYPQRSERSTDRDRRADSCSSSSSSHHSDRDRGAKRSKYDTDGRDGDRSRAPRDRGRNRERERHRATSLPHADSEVDSSNIDPEAMHPDWSTPNGEENRAEGSSYTRHANHPAASQWSAISAGRDEGEWPPERPASGDDRGDRGDRGDRTDRGDRGDQVDRRHEWRRQDRGERGERGNRAYNRGERRDRRDRGERPDRPERMEKKETMETADHYLSEARRLKHHADTLMDRLAKSLMYVEAVLSFIECGNAMEHDRISEPNKNVTMYKDTFSLIRHIYKFRGSHDGDVHDKEKKLSVLSLRIQSLLCLKLFNLKKTETTNLKRAIDDHTKNANQAPRPQAPSPYQTNWTRTTGTPSPISPTPSPAGSVGSVGSVGSNNGDHRSHAAPTPGGNTNGSSAGVSAISVPARIHQITNNYITHVHNLVQCHELWEQGDQQAAEFPDFFRQLDFESVPLNLHSSIPDLVRYVRTGLRRLTNDT